MGNFKEELRNEVEKSLKLMEECDIVTRVTIPFTKKSLLCNLLHSNPDNWREFMKEHYPAIGIKEDGNYAIFNYSIGADFSNPVIREARGIIIDTRYFTVVCWPFNKFCKYDEPWHDEIDWNHARAEEKIDGSIIKLWFDIEKDEWVFSTNSTIYAENALLSIDSNLTFMDAIESANNYYLINWMIDDDYFQKDCTYIFELVGIQNQVVVKYDRPMLYHIGTRNNVTGQEYDIDLGIIKPKRQYVNSLDFCVNYVSNVLNTSSKNKITGCDSEGLVVVDQNFNRIKVKSPIYVILHNIVSNSKVSKKLLLTLIHDDKLDSDSICKQFPNLSHIIRYYQFKYSEFMYQANSFVDISRKLYKENNNDKKFIANKIKNNKYSSIIFKALGNDYTVEKIMDGMTGGFYHTLCKFIPDYEPEKFGYLFE